MAEAQLGEQLVERLRFSESLMRGFNAPIEDDRHLPPTPHRAFSQRQNSADSVFTFCSGDVGSLFTKKQPSATTAYLSNSPSVTDKLSTFINSASAHAQLRAEPPAG